MVVNVQNIFMEHDLNMGGVYRTDSLLQPASSGQSMNCSFSHVHDGFTREREVAACSGHTIGLFDFMQRCKDRLPPDKSNAFWLGHLSDFDRRCSRLTITCAIKVPREQNETSRQGQALHLLKISCESLDDDMLHSHWSDSVITSTRCVACFYNSKCILV